MKYRKVGMLLDYSVAAKPFTHEQRFFERGFYYKILQIYSFAHNFLTMILNIRL
jgi:hypothetical protein